MPTFFAVSKLEEILKNSGNFVEGLIRLGHQPEGKKKLERVFLPGEAAEMVGKDRTTLARAEKELNIALSRNPSNNRRLGYTIQDVQDFRRFFGTLPWRHDTEDEPTIIGVQTFKGGSGKSSATIVLAHGLATKGYRVLVIDGDHQATTTSMFGYMPDKDLTEDDTVLPFLMGRKDDLTYAIRKTHWPNIDLIPACLQLSDAEIGIVLHLTKLPEKDRAAFFQELRLGVKAVAQNYDVILIDSPPSNGMMALQILIAADALLVPCPPKMFDFASTVQYFTMLENYLKNVDPTKQYRWIKMLHTMYDTRLTKHREFVLTAEALMGDIPLKPTFRHFAEITNLASMFLSPYEVNKPNKDVLAMLDEVCNAVEELLWRHWPSKREKLIARGIVS